MTVNNTRPITPELVAEHGLNEEEYARIVELTDREPTFTELGIWSAMWNEHCSYKSSKRWLKTLPTEGPRVVHGPGENAGVVSIGDGDVVVFKMESHNHPSYIEPYQGAATGVGGILRDVFTMGARPIATMNALRFGEPDHPKTRHLVSGVVAGVGGYGNSFGVPCVGGEVNFHPRYNGNILVNAFAAGIAKEDGIYISKAEGVGLPVVYLGAKTGRDGVGGATMASAEFDDSIDDKRPTVQVGDPFTEKCLLEACLELMETGAVIAIQDMGAAGLTCSAVEMGAKGDLGIKLNLDDVPVRETAMTAYEMMLSESQERMLMVLRPQKEDEANAIFVKWGLDFAIVGETTNTLRFEVFHQGEKVADLPIKELGDEAPEYDRPWVEPGKHSPMERHLFAPPDDYNAALIKLIGSPDLASRRWVWEQYDTMIQGNTLLRPGGDAGVVRVDGHPCKALAFSSDVTPRYVEADPYEGGKQAVAECYRNLIATGAEPLATTDNLNFGNPEKPEIMGQFVAAIRGIGEACEALKMPIVSGNVSLYNETSNANGGGEAILPTPTIAAVGLIEDHACMARIGTADEGDALFLVGTEAEHLAQTLYQREILGEETGPAPEVDLKMERARGDFVLAAIRSGYASACHDISDGGLAIALAEMCLASDCGADCEIDITYPHAALFGEDQARYIVAVDHEWANMFAANSEGSGVSFARIGTVTAAGAGARLKINDLVDVAVADLREAHEAWFPDFMGQTALAEAAE
ncbi:MAG: phosphoribosylformylglycinamidine synthase subunit PurL [Pseudomonadota bacterium]